MNWDWSAFFLLYIILVLFTLILVANYYTATILLLLIATLGMVAIVSELLNGYSVNLVKPTPVVLALGCLVTILEFSDYRLNLDKKSRMVIAHHPTCI